MADRLKVLISAYACEPNKGSEPEVGWQWGLQMARFHEVTVLTRANNRAGIEAGLEALKGRQPLPKFIYHDRGRALMALKRRFKLTKAYYVLWQRSAREVVSRLHQAHRFDLMHHVTFAAFRYPTVIWGHGVPSVWGPIGGIESIPRQLLPWGHPASLAGESLRNLSNVIQSGPDRVLPRRAAASAVIFVSTVEMQKTFLRLGRECELMPAIGLSTGKTPHKPHRQVEGPLKLLFVGNIIALKGIDLALEALKESRTKASFTLIGTGNFMEAARRLADKSGLKERVTFHGWVAHEAVLNLYSDYDVFIFPSLHDTGGYAVIEAMLNELPVICLDCGGPAVAVRENCGVKVPLGSRARVIAGLASAIRRYDERRELVISEGQAARAVVLQEYDWDRKGARMNEHYRQALARHKSEQKQAGSERAAFSSC
jgi:glycosyltransferase involved in cell wall biosynthesis